jgi:UDP-2,4-diacetamido-2,4,6-trideoxy-beta-L-altropyranose hydrolase
MIALGQLCRISDFEIHYIISSENKYLLESLYNENFIVHNILNQFEPNTSEDQEYLLNIANEIKPNWIVLDGNHFDIEYEKIIKNNNYRLMSVVDYSITHTYADLLFDQNYGAENNKYSVEPYTIVLAGIKHSLLRKEFLNVNKYRNIQYNDRPNRLLITLGGGSKITDGVNCKIINAISKIKDIDYSATLVCGPFSQKVNYLKELAAEFSSNIRVKKQINDIAVNMSKSTVSILSGGSVMWEAVYMRLPFMGIALTTKQVPYLEFLSKKGLCINLGWHGDLNVEKLTNNISKFMENSLIGKNIIKHMKTINIGQNNELLTILNKK